MRRDRWEACPSTSPFDGSESEVERHYRDACILGIGGGTNEIMNEIVSKQLGL